MTSCYEDALRELTATLEGGSMGTASDRAGLVERLGTMVDAAAASHAEAGYAQDKARASARLALEAAFCAFGRGINERRASSPSSPDPLSSPAIANVLDLALLAATEDVCAATTPFVMLEVILEACTMHECKEIWDLLEARRDIVADNKFVPTEGRRNTRSKLALLRIANNLLRRLSHKNDTEFCGRVVMFLAYVYPLSERSGVNLKGDINTMHPISFEDEETFKASEAQAREEEARRRKHATGESEDSAKGGRREGAEKSNASGDDVPVDEDSVDYELYMRFWDLQRFSSNPNLPFEKIKQWKEFKADVDAILSAFEKFELKSDSAATGGLSVAPSAANSGTVSPTRHLSTATVYNPKFLTSSRLLRLQLQDPELRRNILCQILIICDRMLSPEAKMPDAYRTSKAIAATVTLEGICSRALNLLRSTEPDGPAFTRGVQHVLQRERVWVQWKEARCEGYERFSEVSQDEIATVNKAEARKTMVAIAKAKRKAVAGGDGSVARSKKARENRRPPAGMVRLFEATKTNQDIMDACAAQRKEQSDVAQLAQYREAIAEAEDPENGIEEQYHPKKESLFCWKALRALSSAGHLDVFEFIEKTESEPTGSVVTAFKLLSDKEAGVDLKKMAAEAKKAAKARQAAEKSAKAAAEKAAKAAAAAAAKSEAVNDGGESGTKRKRKRKKSEDENGKKETVQENEEEDKEDSEQNKHTRKKKKKN
eukprot:g2536.t1